METVKNKVIEITVRDRVATHIGDDFYVCGNTDYEIHFDFDEEWDALDIKTARFIADGNVLYPDRIFSGNVCTFPDNPPISNTTSVRVGVFAGNLHTTTPARIPAAKSILCGTSTPAAPEEDTYHQAMEEMSKVATEARAQAEASAQSAEASAQSAVEAAESAQTAGRYSGNADAQAQAAQGHAEAAAKSSGNADAQAQAAAKSASEAGEAAENAAASAAASAQSAVEAAASAQTATTQADDAEASAKDAQSWAGKAETFASNAKASATAASASASAALDSERNAGSYSATATTKASDAKTSASNAATFAANAAISETNAAASASKAAASAEAAAKAVIPGVSASFQQLVSDADGKPMWEDRTHYLEYVDVVVLEEMTLTAEDDGVCYLATAPNAEPTEGGTYDVIWNGTTYACTGVAVDASGIPVVMLGNASAIGGEDTGEPFAALFLPADQAASMGGVHAMIVPIDGATEVTLSISGQSEIVHKLPDKFLNSANTNIKNGLAPYSLRQASAAEESDEYKLGEGATAFGGLTKASGTYAHAEGSGTTASGDTSHAEGNGTTASGAHAHAEGFRTIAGDRAHAEGHGTEASGIISHAEGSGTTASGNTSHAEGVNTTAEGDYSHAEGYKTTASGERSHAEGSETIASGTAAHAEGAGTEASGVNAHAEGYDTTASGDRAHAEGGGTTASGTFSHAEGCYTEAASYGQHVQGKHNIVDSAGKYAHIVGNGSSTDALSNAHTLDWSGNAWYAGDVYVGGDGQDSGERLVKASELGGEYEMIETITLEEDLTYIARTEEPDGTPYNFKALYIDARMKAAASASYAQIRMKTDGSEGQNAVYISGGLKTTESHWHMFAQNERGLLDIKYSNPVANYYDAPGAWCAPVESSIGVKAAPIVSLAIESAVNMATGSIIKIWGVRANA